MLFKKNNGTRMNADGQDKKMFCCLKNLKKEEWWETTYDLRLTIHGIPPINPSHGGINA